MGQAKRRGTFEQRKAAAIDRAASEQAERDRLSDIAYAERQRLRHATSRHGSLAVALALVAMSQPRT